jgi:hypothetical protein
MLMACLPLWHVYDLESGCCLRQLARNESQVTAVALTGRAAAVEAGHLLVGLGSLCRSDLDEVLQRRKFSPASREAAAADAALVRERFDKAGADPRALRRSLRKTLADAANEGDRLRVPHRIHACPCRKSRPSRSRGMFVLVEDAAQAFTPAYVDAGDLPWIGDRLGQGVQRSGVRDALVGPMAVVEPLELPQSVAEVALVPDQRAVQLAHAGTSAPTSP